MKFKSGDKLVIFALIAVAALVIYLSYSQRAASPYASANLGDAPNASTYANAFYGNPYIGNKNVVPPVADTLFDTKY